MIKILKIGGLLLLSAVILLSIPSCGQGGISQEEYDAVKDQLSETQSQVQTLQNELVEVEITETQYQELNNKFEELQNQNDIKTSELGTLQAQYEELGTQFDELETQNEQNIIEIEFLNKQYDDLKQQYDALIAQPEAIVIEDVEQLIFGMINQERVNNGLVELEWGKNIDWVARTNNREMSDKNKELYGGWPSWQEVHWAVGYDTAEEIAEATMIIWKNNPYRYEQNIVNEVLIYGAVDVLKSGEIYFITYVASLTR